MIAITNVNEQHWQNKLAIWIGQGECRPASSGAKVSGVSAAGIIALLAPTSSHGRRE
jgi:hypothetical protein